MFSAKWNTHFLTMAELHGTMSKDPTTHVGAIIVGPDKEILSAGFNGFPRGVDDNERLNDRETKYRLMVHAEENAILAAARKGVQIIGSTLFFVANSEGVIWGGASCIRCAVSIIQAGISEIVCPSMKTVPNRWLVDTQDAQDILKEAGVSITEVKYHGHFNTNFRQWGYPTDGRG